MVAFEDFDGQMHRHMIHLPNEDVDKILNTGIMVTVQFIMLKAEKSYAGQITLDINGKKMRKTAYGKTERIVKNKLLEYRIQAKLKKTHKAYYNAYTAIEENKRYSGKIDITPFLIYFADNVYNAYNEKTTDENLLREYKKYLDNGEVTEKKNPGFGNLYCQITVQTNFPPKCLKKIFKMPHMPQ